MKKALSLLLCIVMVLSAVNIAGVLSFAETSADGKYDYTVSGGNATIVKYNIQSDTGTFTVPSAIGKYPVTAIEDFCFSQCQLSKILIPNSVVRVGDVAFEKCKKLTSVTFGSGLRYFGTNVFSETPMLMSINVSSANAYFKSVDGVLFSKDGTVIYAYPVAKADEEFVVPNTVKSIEHYAFDGANNLKSITIGTGMTMISDLAFIGAFNVENISILGTVTSIGNNAFGNINRLKSINIPDTVTYIGKEAFQDDNDLKSLLIPASVNYIGVDAFEATAPDFLVYCYSGSYAVTYCENYNIEYELVDSVLSSVVVTAQPEKVEYCKGEELDTTGLVISAVYTNGISRTITGYQLSAFSSETTGAKAVTVSYTDGGVTRSTAFMVYVVDHRWQQEGYVAGKAPTCTEAGQAMYRCKICGGEDIKEVAALGHVPYDDIWERPNCTESGMKDIICDRCGDVLEADIVVPALGHISNSYIKEPNCTETGSATGKCTRCKIELDGIVLPALGHNFEKHIIEPSCTAGGVEITSCSRCGAVEDKPVYTPAKEHQYVGYVKEATCTEDGYTKYVCALCANTYFDNEVPALQHDFAQECVQANCTHAGYIFYRCARCTFSYYGMFESAKGHDFTKKIKNPTSVNMGYTLFSCQNCGYYYYGDIKEPTGPTSVSASVADTVEVGKTVSIKTTLTPAGIVDRVYFLSSNTKIATVNASGVVTGKGLGTVKIKCYLSNGKAVTVKVKVKTPSTQIDKLLSVAKGRLKVTWSKVGFSDGYLIQYSTDKNFKKNRIEKYVAGKKNVSYIFKNLSSGKRYYVRIAAYKLVSGQKSFSNWSKVKNIKVK